MKELVERLAQAVLKARSTTGEWKGSARATKPTQWDRIMAKRIAAVYGEPEILRVLRAEVEALPGYARHHSGSDIHDDQAIFRHRVLDLIDAALDEGADG